MDRVEADLSEVKTLADIAKGRNVTPAPSSVPSPRSEARGENSPKQNLWRIEAVNNEMRTERRSVNCSSEILHAGDRIGGSYGFATLLRVTVSRSDVGAGVKLRRSRKQLQDFDSQLAGQRIRLRPLQNGAVLLE